MHSFPALLLKLPVLSSNSDVQCDNLSFLQKGQIMVHSKLPTSPPQWLYITFSFELFTGKSCTNVNSYVNLCELLGELM